MNLLYGSQPSTEFCRQPNLFLLIVVLIFVFFLLSTYSQKKLNRKEDYNYLITDLCVYFVKMCREFAWSGIELWKTDRYLVKLNIQSKFKLCESYRSGTTFLQNLVLPLKDVISIWSWPRTLRGQILILGGQIGTNRALHFY